MSIARYVKFWRPSEKSNKALRTRRNIISAWVAVLSAGLFILAIAYASDTRHFMPGPITTVHGTLERCTDCHSNISKGRFGWLHAVVAPADPDKDATACLSCHKMGEAARNPHGIELARLDAYVRRAKASPNASKRSTASRVREAVLPVDQTFSEGVFCATCHKEHKGQTFDLKAMDDAQCHTCHAVQFDNFFANHPEFDSYPFRRRTRINFDHTGHFNKHFPEWRTKKEAKDIPGACADCHTVDSNGGHMDVKPFAQICSACHLDQITGVERATGPKGIAVLTLPGLDIETLKEKNVEIGEWPEEAEGEIGPLMQLLIGRDEERRKMLKVTGELDLLDLTEASDEQIEQVRKLAWEVKRLFYALTMSGMSDFFKRLKSTTGTRLSQNLVTQLSASMPHDVLLSSQRDWLPKLADEINDAPAQEPERESPTFTTETSQPENVAVVAPDRKPPVENASPTGSSEEASSTGPSQNWRIDPFGRLLKGNEQPDDDDEEDSDEETDASDSESAEAEEVDAESGTQSDIDVDTENWTELGGWYRKDYAILYKPTGHADPFFRAWLDLTSRLFGESNLVAPAFSELAGKDAQGQCTKCHSVDATRNASRLVNWMPSSLATRDSPFTLFDHEPHFGVAQKDGCFSCHKMSKAKGYLDTYKGTDPFKYVSNFKNVKKQVCAECHGKMQVREDCLLCHKYHVNEIMTPIMATKVPKN